VQRVEAPGTLDVAAVRADFPILEGGLAYLDNAATTQKPRQVIEALAGYYRESNANVHRALHRLGEAATEAFEEGRRTVARFIAAAGPAEIVFTRGATEAINLVAASWGRSNVSAGDEILLTEMEHHSNLVPWQLLAEATGATLRFIPFREDGSLDLDRLEALLTARTKLVAVTAMSNVFGTINDTQRIVGAAHAAEIPVLLDGAQSVPHLPVDVQALDCDFLAFSGHKMYGPTGIGVLYGKKRLLEAMPPYQAGGEMIRSVWLDRSTWNDLPYKFEAGTPHIAGAVGLKAAIEYLSGLGMERIRAYEDSLTRYALERLGAVDGLTVHGEAPVRGGVISFTLDGVHPHDVAQYLDSEDIAIRAGHHCAYPIMRKLGVPATARASLAFYNTAGEIERLAGALNRAKEFFRVAR
jgi:cysteine desulfurase/selenocysteine lyase